jgi:hydroxymethylglutaryl-CoA synthase
MKTGISSIGLAFPPHFISAKSLAELRNVEASKFTVGLGCKDIALCPENYTIVEMCVEAAKRALSRWKGDLKDIGLIAVGTESAVDMSRPLSAFVAEELHLSGQVRSYEVKHACYGGTLAVRQAVEWKMAGVAKGKAALVIAADIALYSLGDPGEPTQGAGAVAMIIDTPDIAEIAPASYAYSKPVFDFWRPVNEQFPIVDGAYSIECYKEAAEFCFRALLADKKWKLPDLFTHYEALCFHVPFPKMVKKAFAEVCKARNYDDEQIEALYQEKLAPTMEWNSLSGNSYTASLWISVARALKGLHTGQSISAFSYGSGCGAELLVLTAGPKAQEGLWAKDVETDMAKRTELTAEEYVTLRKKHNHNKPQREHR